MADHSEFARELEQARGSIAAAALQIERVQHAIERQSTDASIRELLQIGAAVAASIGEAPYRALLQAIVDAARRLLRARAASILIVDHAANELVFEAGSGGADVIDLRIPVTHGLAGWVVSSGEPIAVSDVTRDARWARDFAERVGYVPRSLVAVPLLVNGDVEGVLELLDKTDATSFGLEEMELLGMFARPAAIGLEQARTVRTVAAALVQQLQQHAAEAGAYGLAQSARSALTSAAGTGERLVELARLSYEIGRRGDRALDLALQVLSAVARNT